MLLRIVFLRESKLTPSTLSIIEVCVLELIRNMPSSVLIRSLVNISVNSALANPPIYKAYDNVIDNYNHYTGKGFDSLGH